jgi:type II secretory pathway pseudopilin PulG
MKGSHSQQQGVAMLILVFMIALALTSYLVSGLNSETLKRNQEAKTAQALVVAKDALIGRAITDMERPGSLPCPDTSGDGSAELFVGNQCPAYVGWFPWRTLGTSELLDGNGDRLLYALSRNHRDHASAQPLNLNTIGGLTLDGVGDYVSIIFAPGRLIAGQNRPNNLIQNYLDGQNADGDDTFTRMANANMNDRVLTLTRNELMEKIALRLLGEIKGSTTWGLNAYYAFAGEYPYADDSTDGFSDVDVLNGIPTYQGHTNTSLAFSPETTTMLSQNGWLPLINYQLTNDRQQVSLALGTLGLVVTP